MNERKKRLCENQSGSVLTAALWFFLGIAITCATCLTFYQIGLMEGAAKTLSEVSHD